MTTKHKTKTDESVYELVARWTQASGPNQHLSATRDLLRFLTDELYHEYQPFSEKPLFWERLACWLQNVTLEADQQRLLEFVPWLLFVGREEMATMYRAAFTGPITRWIIDDAGLDIADPALSGHFTHELRRTWFGSLAGMDIGSFMRVNGIDEQSLRPDFRVLSFLGDPSKVRDYLGANEHNPGGYRRIVVVEDFVGTGQQMKKAIPILQDLKDVPILLCPVIVAQEGFKVGVAIAKANKHIVFREHFRIPSTATIDEVASVDGEPEIFALIRELITRTWPRLKTSKPYDKPFGFENSGSLLLTYLNCPNNVPPLIHRQADGEDGWEPLFPRVVRET